MGVGTASAGARGVLAFETARARLLILYREDRHVHGWPPMSKCDRMEYFSHRRSVLKVAMAFVAAGLVLPLTWGRALAAKATQKAAKYQDSPRGPAQCDNCALWIAPDQCKIVEGPLSPTGWCAVYSRRPGA